VASSHRTFDLALWSAVADRRAARQAARQLTGLGWRVRLMDGAQPAAAANARVSMLLLDGQRTPGDLLPDLLVARSLTPALLGRLALAGRRSEDQVDVRQPLGAPHVHRANMASYDAIAEPFAERWFAHPPMRELEHFLARLPRRSRVLDAGCGPAHHAALMARAGHDVIGIDASAGMLRQARLRAAQVRTARMSLDALCFRAGAFDAVWCAAAILHVPREHLPQVLAGFRRVLRPGGWLGLNFQVGRGSEVVERGADRRFFEYYPDARSVIRELRRAGFTVDSTLCGETGRNTHGLDLTLRWATVYASAGHRFDGGIAGQDR
jgi:SAM-dependent methyltransferase